MVHRRILDVAEAESDASIEGIDDRVSGASMELVERVLKEYGDPATGESDVPDVEAGETAGPGPTAPNEREDDGSGDAESARAGETDGERTESAEPTMSQNGTEPSETTGDGDGETTPELDDLSERQRETVRAVYGSPDAPQEVIADELGVTRATVSRRLNEIPGFEWHDREAFVESLFDGTGGTGSASSSGSSVTGSAGDPDARAGTDADASADAEGGRSVRAGERAAGGTVSDREERVESPGPGGDGAPAGSIPPELAHKVVHACIESDRISEDEELELLRSLMARGG